MPKRNISDNALGDDPLIHGPFQLATVAGLHGFILDWLVYTPDKPLTDHKSISETLSLQSGEWRYFHVVNDYAINLDLLPDCCSSSVYAASFVWSDSKQDVIVEVGAYDGFRLWLNGRLIADLRDNEECRFGDNIFKVTVNEGSNMLILEMDKLKRKLYSVRLYGLDGEPLKGVCVSVSGEDMCAPVPPRLNPELPLENNCYSPFQYFNRVMSCEPVMRFRGNSKDDWLDWRRRFKSKLLSLLGDFPERCPLKPKVLERVDLDVYIREKVIFQSEPDVWVPAYILIPKNIVGRGRAILCIHGHGRGKDDVVGLDHGDPAAASHIKRYNYDYAVQYTLKGYITISPDLRNFGERVDPEYARSTGKIDPCITNFYRAMSFGGSLVTLNVWDLIRTLDYLSSRSEVDPERIGCMGLSNGGRMTMYLAAIDDRVRVAVLSSIINSFKERLLPNAWGCGGQYVPGLLKYGDVHEICSLIAPRPLLFELGIYDPICPAVYANDIYRQVRRVYRAAGAEDKLDIEIFHGDHRFNGMKALSWFDRWL